MKFHHVKLNTLHPNSFRVTFVAIKKPHGQFYSPSSRPPTPSHFPSEKYMIQNQRNTASTEKYSFQIHGNTLYRSKEINCLSFASRASPSHFPSENHMIQNQRNVASTEKYSLQNYRNKLCRIREIHRLSFAARACAPLHLTLRVNVTIWPPPHHTATSTQSCKKGQWS